nr:hypothetical protein [Neobacillus sp. Marseille-Q6967]
MQFKGWIFLVFCILSSILTVHFWDAGISYENVILPKEMDTFPVNVLNFTIGSGSSTQELNEFATTFKWLTLLPLSFAIVFYWRLIKLLKGKGN